MGPFGVYGALEARVIVLTGAQALRLKSIFLKITVGTNVYSHTHISASVCG